MSKNNASIQGTDRINHFDMPRVIDELKATFKYKYFKPNEQQSEVVSSRNDVPRYVYLKWSSNKDIIPLDISSKSKSKRLTHKENLYFATDLNDTYVKISTNESENQEMFSRQRSDYSEGSKLEYLLKQSVSNSVTEALEEAFGKGELNQTPIPVLDPVSKTPMIMTKPLEEKQPSDIFIRKTHVSSILKRSDRSPFFSQKQWEDYQESANMVQKHSREKEKNSAYKRKLSALWYSIKTLGTESNPESSLLSYVSDFKSEFFDWQLVGYVLIKYRLLESKEEFVTSRFVQSIEYEDPHVSYGKTYKYRIIPVYGKMQVPDSDEIVLLGSDESASIEIKCEEKRQPSPPMQIKFNYIGDNEIKMKWERPRSEIKDKGEIYDTNDIKGYQIFLRHSLLEPYHLYKYFTFNNTVPTSARQYAKEYIEDSYIVSSEYDISSDVLVDDIPEFKEFKEHVLKIRPNVDYYVAMCSIDAHGNSSNYSTQFKIRRNNVTGEVEMKSICQEGAPKQYPNVLIPGKLVNPSFKASGYRKLDIYFAPDSDLSIPNLETEAVNIQLFELETQVEKNIAITIKEPTQ